MYLFCTRHKQTSVVSDSFYGFFCGVLVAYVPLFVHRANPLTAYLIHSTDFYIFFEVGVYVPLLCTARKVLICFLTKLA